MGSSSSEHSYTSSWPDDAWLAPVREHVRGSDHSADGGSSVSGETIDQVREDIRRLSFYVQDDSGRSTSVTPNPYRQRPKQSKAERLSREEKRWTRLYQVLGEEVQRKLAKLRMSINAMADVGRLPTEILCLIFEIVATSSSSHKAVINLTQVCRHWRKVAITYPKLWSKIYLTMPLRDIARSLRRSNGMPLDFSISGSWGTESHWQYFNECIPRCYRIAIKDIPGEWIVDMAPWLDNSAPLLEELVLAAIPAASAAPTTPFMPVDVDAAAGFATLDMPLFDQHTPKLRTIRLDTILLPRSSFHVLLNITHLTFMFGHGPRMGTQIPSHRYILDMLSCAPQLQDAVIERYGTRREPYFRPIPTNLQASSPRTSLPRIRRLCLQGMAPEELGFLEYLDVPVESCIKIGVDLAQTPNFGPLLELFDNPSGGLKNLTRVQEVMFVGSGNSSVRNPKSDQPTKWAVHLWDKHSKLAFAILFRSPRSRDQNETIIWLLSSVLFKRGKFKHLSVPTPNVPTSLAWSNWGKQGLNGPGIFIRILISHWMITDLAFDECAYVEEALKLIIASERGKRSRPTINKRNSSSTTITATSVTTAAGPTSSSVCPNLAYLALSRCRTLSGDVLVDLARAKDKNGHTLRKLRIRACNEVKRRAVQDLRWLVETVEWDEEEGWDGFSVMADLDPDEVLILDEVEDGWENWEVLLQEQFGIEGSGLIGNLEAGDDDSEDLKTEHALESEEDETTETSSDLS